MYNATTDGDDRLSWRWDRGAQTTKADFGNPLFSTDYELCIYDAVGGVDQLALSHRVESGAGWTETLNGFTLRLGPQQPRPEGIWRMRLSQGSDGNARISVGGSGANLRMPPFPLQQDDTITVQLRNGSVCWEATFSTSVERDDRHFRARSDP